MDGTEEEERANRFYAAQDWISRQAVLVTYLLRLGHPVLAHNAIQGVLRLVGQFGHWDAASLQQTYQAERRGAEEQYQRAVAS